MSTKYYNTNAEKYCEQTVELDMSSLYAEFVPRLPTGGAILDAGCGPGRDAKAFADMGFKVTAFDGSQEMVRCARQRTGLPVVLQLFHQVSEIEEYDGIWACASLLHVPFDDLNLVLSTLNRSLKPGGIFYLSFGHGEGTKDGGERQFTNLTEEALEALVSQIDRLVVESSWVTEDLRDGWDKKWLNAILVKAQ